MVKVKIKASQPWPLQNEEHKRHSKEYIYEHDINDEETWSYRIVACTTNLINDMKYHGLKKFTIEMLENE